MSFHPYRVQSIEDERKLLKEMLKLQRKVRVDREKERYLRTAQSRHYTKMLQPITNSIKEFQQSKPMVQVHTSTSTDGDKLIPKDEKKVMKNAPGNLFKETLRNIPDRFRDDGVFGLNVSTMHIGPYTFMVDDNTLHIIDHENLVRSYMIEDYQLWQLLVVKRPNDINLKLKDIKGKNTLALDEFIKIVQDLDLVNIALKEGFQIKNRSKYKLLPKVGHGFLFTSLHPEFTHVNPDVVVIPSDKKGLLRALVKSVAELRSGNTSMQNVVVPLAQEAKRLKILPPGLLSPKEMMTWVFA